MSDFGFPLPEIDDAERRAWLLAASTAGAVATAATAVPFVASFAPSERARALGAAVEVDIADIPPGGMKTVEWRGKPVWIVRRTPEMIAALAGHDEQLADPASAKDQQPDAARNATRSMRPELFVAVGICTHLGCSPTFRKEIGPADLGADWSGGWFCPCHGSRFDLAARVYNGSPAPTNLVI
uniref:ubiquinol-cytochrome c reductase iron-sulfur subunit n=1 Tax=Piscinibacter sp. TaxID=1903157 RepID=UPI003784FD73